MDFCGAKNTFQPDSPEEEEVNFLFYILLLFFDDIGRVKEEKVNCQNSKMERKALQCFG